VCIGQPARSSGSVIDLSASDADQAVAFAALLAKAVSIRRPAPCSSNSVIDLSAPDAALAVVTSTLPAKPVFICQPAPRSFGSVLIDLSAPDGALAFASASTAKPVFGLSSGIVIDISGNDAVKENCVLADQNHVFGIVVGQMPSPFLLWWPSPLHTSFVDNHSFTAAITFFHLGCVVLATCLLA
jgi:hypothetical protein